MYETFMAHLGKATNVSPSRYDVRVLSMVAENISSSLIENSTQRSQKVTAKPWTANCWLTQV